MPRNKPLREQVDGNELDLSLSELTEIPVTELVSNTGQSYLYCRQSSCISVNH